MQRSRFSTETAALAHENTILASDVLPQGIKAPFGHAWGYLDHPAQMDAHTHPKAEVYFFFKGNGFVQVDGEKEPVAPGDVIYIPPDALHTVINEENAELLWAAFWWDEVK